MENTELTAKTLTQDAETLITRDTSFITPFIKRLVVEHGRRFVQFGLVGASGVLVNTVLLYVLAEVGALNHLLAAALATEAAIISNFLFNNYWTFGDVKRKISWMRRAPQYNFIALGGLLISVAVLAALTYLLGFYYLFANFFAIGAGMIWNYAVNRRWTWPVMHRFLNNPRVVETEDFGRHG